MPKGHYDFIGGDAPALRENRMVETKHYTELGLVNTREMFRKAMAGGYAVPAYNFNTYELKQIYNLVHHRYKWRV